MILAKTYQRVSIVQNLTSIPLQSLLQHQSCKVVYIYMYMDSSTENTFVSGVIELSRQQKVFVVGDNFKRQQTKMQFFLINLPVYAGINPVSIVRSNHLGTNILWTAFDDHHALFQVFRSHHSLPSTSIINTNNYNIPSYKRPIFIFSFDTTQHRRLP